MNKEKLKNRVLNGGRESGKSLRLLIEMYENQIEDLKSDHEHNLELMKGLNDKITDLEKENVELKEKVENLQKYLDTQNSYRECAETWLKFTKAKELLQRFIKWARTASCECEKFDVILEQTEQLLKEIEE